MIGKNIGDCFSQSCLWLIYATGCINMTAALERSTENSIHDTVNNEVQDKHTSVTFLNRLSSAFAGDEKIKCHIWNSWQINIYWGTYSSFQASIFLCETLLYDTCNCEKRNNTVYLAIIVLTCTVVTTYKDKWDCKDLSIYLQNIYFRYIWIWHFDSWFLTSELVLSKLYFWKDAIKLCHKVASVVHICSDQC